MQVREDSLKKEMEGSRVMQEYENRLNRLQAERQNGAKELAITKD